MLVELRNRRGRPHSDVVVVPVAAAVVDFIGGEQAALDHAWGVECLVLWQADGVDERMFASSCPIGFRNEIVDRVQVRSDDTVRFSCVAFSVAHGVRAEYGNGCVCVRV